MLYRYYIPAADTAGETRHPQKVIRELAPDAHDFQPAPIGDCWLFEASEIQNLPAYIERVVKVSAVTVFKHDSQPCRYCGHSYERDCHHGSKDPYGPLVRCPKCGCPADGQNV